jgi:hypothetical protein
MPSKNISTNTTDMQQGAMIAEGSALWRGNQQHIIDDLFAGDAVGLGLAVDLSFDQRRIDVAGADCVAGDAMLGGDVGRLSLQGNSHYWFASFAHRFQSSSQ